MNKHKNNLIQAQTHNNSKKEYSTKRQNYQ